MTLTDKQILEGNELIAEFMNMKTGMIYQLMNSNLNLTILDRTRTFCYSHELIFHKDWNWLMTVKNKLETMDYMFEIHSNKFIVWKLNFSKPNNKDIILNLSFDMVSNQIDFVWYGIVRILEDENLV